MEAQMTLMPGRGLDDVLDTGLSIRSIAAAVTVGACHKIRHSLKG